MTPWTVVHQASLLMKFSRPEYWSGLPFLPPKNLPNPGIEPASLASPALAGRFFSTSTTCCSVAQLCSTFCSPMDCSLLKLMPTESVMPSNHFVLCHPILLPSIFPSVRVIYNESALCTRWPKYWSFSFSLSDEYPGLISFRIDSFCYGEGGGRRVHVWERMYTRDGFMSMYGKTNTVL